MSNCSFINEEDLQSLIERKLNEDEISENLYQCNAHCLIRDFVSIIKLQQKEIKTLEKRVEELELFEQNIAENGVL